MKFNKKLKVVAFRIFMKIAENEAFSATILYWNRASAGSASIRSEHPLVLEQDPCIRSKIMKFKAFGASEHPLVFFSLKKKLGSVESVHPLEMFFTKLDPSIRWDPLASVVAERTANSDLVPLRFLDRRVTCVSHSTYNTGYLGTRPSQNINLCRYNYIVST